MPPALAIPLFFSSLVVALVSAGLFARTLDRLGVRIGLPEALLGLLTALAADGPEITSAIVALVKGAGGVSLGVVVGSNVFNLAAMLGLTAVVAGGIRLRGEALLIEGAVGVLVTLIATGVVLDRVPAGVAVGLIGCVLLPYLLLLTRGPRIARRLPFSEKVDRGLARALGEREHWGDHDRVEDQAAWKLAGIMVPAVALIVVGSAGMVESAIALGNHWNVPSRLLGLLVLAPLTSVPNAVTALRLGRADRGSALVSETLNSNTINLVAGLAIPALFVSVVSITTKTGFELAWLLAMTFVALFMLSRPGGMRRRDGALLIGLYLIFCIVEIA